MHQKVDGFTVLEILTTLAIIAFIAAGLFFEIPSVAQKSTQDEAIQKASILDLAKQSFLAEKGFEGEEAFNKKSDNEEKFLLLKKFIPFASEEMTLASFSPKNVSFELNTIQERTTF